MLQLLVWCYIITLYNGLQVGMLGVIVSAITVIMLGYLMVGFSGYLAFPTTVEGNVLKSFPTHDILMQVITPGTSVSVQFAFLHARQYDGHH